MGNIFFLAGSTKYGFHHNHNLDFCDQIRQHNQDFWNQIRRQRQRSKVREKTTWAKAIPQTGRTQRYVSSLKYHHPISKRNNSAIWEAVAKELNRILREQGLTTVRTVSQCKSKIKNLEDEYKRVKDHNSKSGNNRETFTYYEELNEILGCRPKIAPKTVIECGFEDAVLPSNIPPSRKSTSPTLESEEVLEELSESSDGEAENRSLADVPSRREPVAKKALASMPSSLKQKQQNSTESCDARNDDLAFSESLFLSVSLEAKPLKKTLVHQSNPPLKGRKEGIQPEFC